MMETKIALLVLKALRVWRVAAVMESVGFDTMNSPTWLLKQSGLTILGMALLLPCSPLRGQAFCLKKEQKATRTNISPKNLTRMRS